MLARAYTLKPKMQKGQGMVEFALVTPLLLLLMLGIFEFGRLIFVYSAVSSASREAARYGASVGNVGATTPNYFDCTNIRERAGRLGSIAGIGAGNVMIEYDEGPGTNVIGTCESPPSSVSLGDRIVVSVDITFQTVVPFLGLPPIPINSTTARSIAANVPLGVSSNAPVGDFFPAGDDEEMKMREAATATPTLEPTATQPAPHVVVYSEPDFPACPSGYTQVATYADMLRRDTDPRSHTYEFTTSFSAQIVIMGWAKEGHPENGCDPYDTNGGCQIQEHEDFSIAVDTHTIGEFWDADYGPEEHAWFQMPDFYANVGGGTHQLTFTHFLQGDTAESVDYKVSLCAPATAPTATHTATPLPGVLPEATPTPLDAPEEPPIFVRFLSEDLGGEDGYACEVTAVFWYANPLWDIAPAKYQVFHDGNSYNIDYRYPAWTDTTTTRLRSGESASYAIFAIFPGLEVSQSLEPVFHCP
jgi:hypothetical protein